MDDAKDEEEMSMELTVDGGDFNRSGSQPGSGSPRLADSLLSSPSTMAESFSDPASRTLIIEDVPESYIENLEDRLENRKKGGGRLESFERDRQNTKNMVAVFAHRTVAENMLRLGSLIVAGVTMKITSPTSMQMISPTVSQSGFDRLRDIRPVSRNISASLGSETESVDVSISDESVRTVVIKGVPDTHKKSLRDFLRNPENGGGRLESCDQDCTNSRNMVAVFAHQKVAENMLLLGTITIFGATMKVGRLESLNESSSSNDNQDVASDTVKVFNIPPKVTESMLKLYLELKRRSGGGPIKELRMTPDKRLAVVRFESTDDAAEVAKRETHQLAGDFLDVVLLESDPAEGSGSCRAIRVSGIDRHKLSSDIISMYFENVGQDEVTDCFLDQDVAVMTFATPKAVQRVLSKKKHVLDNIQLHVEAMSPHSPPPVYVGETERNRLIVKGLPFGITLVKLTEFVEHQAGCGVTGWVLGSKKNSAMLEFDGEPDYAALRRLVNSVPFSGRMVGIQRVPLTTRVQVDGLSEKNSDRSILTYFEEKTGATKGTIRLDRKSKTSVILKFPQHSAMVSVLSQHHDLNGHILTLSPFSKELGCVLPDKVSKDPPDNWIPKSTEVVGSQEQLQYIQNNLQIRERVERTIGEVNCSISWPSSAECAVKLEQKARGGDSEDQEWSDLCTGAFSSLLGDIVTRKLVATPEVLRRLKTRIEAETSEVVVKFDVGSSEIHFTGFSDLVVTYEKKLKALKHEVEKQLEEEEDMKRRKVEVLASLRPSQIRYFQQCGVADEVTERFTNLNLRVDEQKVQLEGPEEILTDAKLFIFESINLIESRFLDISQDLTELITTEPTKTYVSDYLKQFGIRAIIEEPQPGRNGVTVHAIGQVEIQKAEAFLTTDFVSKKLEMNDAARHTMLSPDWEVLVESLKQDYRFFLLHSSNDALIVSGRKDLVDGIVRKIQEVFEKHVTTEHFVSMKSSNAQLIGMFRKSDMETVEKKLRESAMGGKLKQVLTQGGASGFALKGNPKEVEAAKKQLETLVKSATEAKQEISRPGVVSLNENPKWKEFLDTVQQKHPVIVNDTVTNPYAPTSSDLKCGPRHQTLVNGHSIVVVLGEIADIQKGGALINPTNPRLELSRGLGLEIVKMGGKEIQEKCAQHIDKSGNLSPGSIFVSESGRLLCDIIIHVVEPTTFDDQAVNVYQLAIKTALEAALRNGSEFVAFPLSFGAAFKRQLLFATIKEFFEKPDSAGLKSVQFVDDDVEQLKKLEEQLKDYGFSQASTAVPGSPQLPPTPSSPTELMHTTPEGIVVKFYKGTICALKVDVIVNSTAKTLALGSGGVSKAIHAGAGPEIQKECHQKAPSGLSQFGEILATKAYNLSCKAIYHGAAVQWDNGAGPAEKVLRAFVSNALTQAHRQSMTSIAIPAIGSGTLKVPHDTVVNVLLDEIFKFSKTNPGTSLRTIYTVAYEQNQPSVTAFEKKFLSLQPVPSTTPINRQDFKGMGLKDDRQSLVDYDTTSGEDEPESVLPDESETEFSFKYDAASRYNLRQRNSQSTLQFASSDDNYEDSGDEYVPPSKPDAEEESSTEIDYDKKYSKEPVDLGTSKTIQIGQTKERKGTYDFEEDFLSSSETDTDDEHAGKTYSKKRHNPMTSKTIQKKKQTIRIYDFEEDNVPSSAADAEEENVDKKYSKKPVDSATLKNIQNREAKNTQKRMHDSREDYVPSSESDAVEKYTDEEYSKKPVDSTASKNNHFRQMKKRKISRMYDSENDYVPTSATDTEEESADEKYSKKPDGVMTSKTIQITQTTNTNGKRTYDKKQYCIFCDKPYSKITAHWSTRHAREPEVRQISAERDKKTKLCLITVLRNKGNHIHNCDVMKKGKGELVVTYRPKESKGSNDYRPCEYCLGYYNRKDLYRHRCKVEPMRKRGGRVATRSLMLLPAPDGVKPEVMNVLNGMLSGPVKDAIERDKLLQRLASKLFMRHGHEKKELVRARLREMGRLMVEIQKFKRMENATLEDCLKPRKFKIVVRAVRVLAGFNRDKLTYSRPSLAIKVGHTLRKCCQILKGQAIERSNSQLIEDARQFDDLCEVEWSDEVAFRAKKELYERKRNSTKRLPLTADTKKLVDFLKSEIKSNKENLENDIIATWRYLAELSLAYLIIFNRRRQGEVSNIRLVEFSKARCGTSNSDVESCLSKMERQLCRLFYRVEIAGKRGRTVPLLMDTNMFETLSLLNRKRLEAGVPEDNPFVFAYNKYSSLSHIRGSDCLRKFSVDCGATYPETLRSTSLRKHVATMSQLLSLKDNQLDMLAQFMGHDIRTHREFYRLPEDTLQLAKLSKLFLIMEKGNVKNFSGKTLDNVLLKMDADSELEPDDEEEEEFEDNSNTTDVPSKEEESNDTAQEMEQVAKQQTRRTSIDNQDSDEASVRSQPMNRSKKRFQRRWSQKEKDAVMRHLLPDVLRKKVPLKEAVLLCMRKESCLAQRTWKNIRDYCRNTITQARYA